MADKKISQLTAASTPLAGTEVLPIVQSGSTVKVAVSDLTAGRAVSALSTTVTGNMVLNSALGSDVGLLKNTGQGYGVASDRWIGSDGTTSVWFYNVPTGGKHYFAINNTNIVEIAGNDATLKTGNLIQGTAAKGINFTANTPAAGMTSQLLNWYEEGTWTPVLSDGTNNATMSNSTQGHYTRIGNTVFYRARVRLTSLGSVSGSVRVTGLPFTVANVESNYGGGSTIGYGASLNITAGYAVSQIPINTTTYISLYLWDATTGSTALQASEMTNTSDIYFSGQYQI